MHGTLGWRDSGSGIMMRVVVVVMVVLMLMTIRE